MSFHETTQITDTVLMVRPAHFGFNPETASSNAFQKEDGSLSKSEIESKARQEFDHLVKRFIEAGVEVIVVEDTDDPVTPDAVFPNNWVTFHEDGTVITYPMFSLQRRLERREEIIDQLRSAFLVEDRLRLEWHEKEDRFLEGTGSMVLDRVNQIVYACISQRTHPDLLEEFCTFTGYEKVDFHAEDASGMPIYHTNVVMAIGETFAIVALETIKSPEEQAKLLAHLHQSKKEVIEISMSQMYAFAGNMLQLRTKQGATILAMSTQAFESLDEEQIRCLESHTTIVHSPIPTIESYGGGSVRCMLAEVFLPRRSQA